MLWGFSFSLDAQFYNTGDPPGNIRWRVFQSDHFKFIFPAELENQTKDYAVSFDQVWQKVSGQLNHSPKSIPVVIHPHNSRSNGMVVWAPKRMEIYPVPPQDIYPQSWIRQLAIHETRHVAQISKLNQGFTRLLTVFAGEQATGFAAGIIPAWFFEGDAVYAETAFSLSGRGRSPSFEMGIKAQVTDDKKVFSYDKSLFGSYRDYVPNHYEYGYQLVSYASELYGHDFWSRTIDFAGRTPFIPLAFRQGMKKQQNITPAKLYRHTLEARKNEWKKDTLIKISTAQHIVSPEKKEYINYYSPRFISDTSLVALKDGPGFIRQIIIINKNGEEKKLHVPGFLSANKISSGGGKITWSETIPHARWGNQSYSVIKVFDINSKKEQQLTRKTRYYAPSLSPSGNFIAAIENDLQNNCFLVILDAYTGNVIQKEKTEYGTFLQFPEWTGENEIVMTLLDEEGKSIVSFDLSTNQWSKLLPGEYYDITTPVGDETFIWFNSTWNGKENIYVLERNSGMIFLAADSRHGAFNPAISHSNEFVAFLDYTNKGFEIQIVKIDTSSFIPFELPNEGPQPFYKSLNHDPVVFLPDQSKLAEFKSKPYRKLSHLLHFHSWAPFYYDFNNLNPVSNPEIYPGFTLLSQNLLNTTVSQFSYAYKNGNHFTSNSFVYSGFVPVIDIGMEYGDEPLVYSGIDSIGPGEIKNDLLNFRTRFYIPFNLTRNRFISGLIPSLQVNYNNSLYHYTDENEYKRGLATLDWRLNFYSYLKLSQRDISPRWGQQFRLRYYTSPFENENLGNIFSASAFFYFPGILKHHSLRLKGSYQKQNPEKYLYQSYLDFPRGFLKQRTEILHIFNADYFFPIIHPDLSIPGILYLKRIRGSVFYDYAQNQYRVFNRPLNRIDWKSQELVSMGAEILSDFHLFRFLFPFSAGARIIYLPQYGNVSSEFIFSINLDAF